jgi:hypothetical protein
VRNLLTWLLIVFTLSGASSRTAYASTGRATEPSAPILTASNPETPSITSASDGQSAPGSNYPQSHKHSHLIRKVVIAFAICFAFALVVAVASK